MWNAFLFSNIERFLINDAFRPVHSCTVQTFNSTIFSSFKSQKKKTQTFSGKSKTDIFQHFSIYFFGYLNTLFQKFEQLTRICILIHLSNWTQFSELTWESTIFFSFFNFWYERHILGKMSNKWIPLAMQLTIGIFR